jgi:hypothetical protein
MADYEPVDLSELCNAGQEALGAGRRPPVGDQIFHGLPFRIGDPARPEAPCFVLIRPGEAVTVPVGRAAERVVVAHRRLPVLHDGDVTVGHVVAEYTFDVAETGSSPLTIPIRERLEIAVGRDGAWDSGAP